MNKGAQAEAKKLGNVKVVFTGSPAAFSPATQTPFLNGAIARKPNAILIAPTDKTALISPIQRAISAGIPVATVDTFISKPIAFTNISTDNLAGGRAASGRARQGDRRLGRCRRDQRQPWYQHDRPARPGLRPGTEEVPECPLPRHPVLQRRPDEGVQPDVGAPRGALEPQGHLRDERRLRQRRHAGRQGGRRSGQSQARRVRCGPPQVQALKAGTIDALVAQYPYGIGTQGVFEAYQYVTGHKAGTAKHYGTGSAVITRANVNNPAYKKYLYTP